MTTGPPLPPLFRPAFGVEHEAAHRRFEFRGVAAVTVLDQYRTDLFFKQLGARGILGIEGSCGEEDQAGYPGCTLIEHRDTCRELRPSEHHFILQFSELRSSSSCGPARRKINHSAAGDRLPVKVGTLRLPWGSGSSEPWANWTEAATVQDWPQTEGLVAGVR